MNGCNAKPTILGAGIFARWKEPANTWLGLFEPQEREYEIFGRETVEPGASSSCIPEAAAWSLESFAEEQIRGLVRQLFLSDWPRPGRQIVFTPVDQDTDITSICMRVGQILSMQIAGTTCVVEVAPRGTGVEKSGGNGRADRICSRPHVSRLRDLCCQVSSNLWRLPVDVFLNEDGSGLSTMWLRDRLAELRLEFDYTILQGPAAGLSSDATLLGRLSDGVVLVLRANTTRRATAQKAKQMLYSANARLLGTVLSERTFPIPEAIYKRL